MSCCHFVHSNTHETKTFFASLTFNFYPNNKTIPIDQIIIKKDENDGQKLTYHSKYYLSPGWMPKTLKITN